MDPKTISSTYNWATMRDFSSLLTNRVQSTWPLLKPWFNRYVVSRSYQALSAFFSPYNAFFSLSTWFGKWGSWNPFGVSTNTSSFKNSFKKAPFTSIWHNLKFIIHAMERRIQIDSSLAARANDSSKSMPSTWVYPWATNLDLFWTTSPSSSVLFLKIHLVPITCVSLGLGSNSYTSFLTNWCNSWWMDSTQFSSLKASSTFLGSNWAR